MHRSASFLAKCLNNFQRYGFPDPALGASLAWRLSRRISTVMFTCGWAWPARSPIRPILGFWGDSLPWTPMNHRAKFYAASFILGGEIRNRTNKQTNTHTYTHTQWRTVNDISTSCLLLPALKLVRTDGCVTSQVRAEGPLGVGARIRPRPDVGHGHVLQRLRRRTTPRAAVGPAWRHLQHVSRYFPLPQRVSSHI